MRDIALIANLVLALGAIVYSTAGQNATRRAEDEWQNARLGKLEAQQESMADRLHAMDKKLDLLIAKLEGSR